MIKHGLDSSVLINLIVCYDSEFQAFERRGYSHEEDVFYFHDVSVPEVFGVLLNRYKFTKSEVHDSLARIIRNYRLHRIIRRPKHKLYENIVRKVGVSKIGRKDIVIIAGFLRCGVERVHTGDVAFMQVCQDLNMDVVLLSDSNRIKEKQLRQFMKKRFG